MTRLGRRPWMAALCMVVTAGCGAAERGRYFFTAGDGVHGTEMWSSDGTAEGTVMVEDVAPGAESPTFGGSARVASDLYFVVSAPSRQLWKTGGTPQGTALVRDFGSAATSRDRTLYTPTGLTGVGRRLFFRLDDGAHGQELWLSDGTSDGTRLVADLVPGRAGPSIGDLAELGDRAFFSSSLSVLHALYQSDGTEAGTFEVLRNPEAFDLTAAGRSLLLTGPRSVLRSDGTSAGTRTLKTFESPWSVSFAPVSTATGSRVFLVAREGLGAYDMQRNELWMAEGTPARTTRLKLFEGGDSAVQLMAAGDRLFFVVAHAALVAPNTLRFTSELWTSDGTEAGTVRVKPLPSGVQSVARAGGRFFFVLNGGLLSRGYQEVLVGNRATHELWTSDGTEAGTQLLHRSGWIERLDDVDGALFFRAGATAGDPQLRSLDVWRSDGTAPGTVLVRAFGAR